MTLRAYTARSSLTLSMIVLATFALPDPLTQPVSAADQVSDGQWYHTFLNTKQAHQITQGEGITVAVIDT
jgi:hypothetical protein